MQQMTQIQTNADEVFLFLIKPLFKQGITTR